MSYRSTKEKLVLLLEILEAANRPNVPNGTTRRINRDLRVLVDHTLARVCEDALRPNVPNGTTRRIIRIVNPAAA